MLGTPSPSLYNSFVPWLLLVIFVGGCASTESIKDKNPAAGTTVTYNAPLAVVASAARSALQESNLVIHDDYASAPDEHVITAEERAHGWTWGSIVRVTLDAIDPSRTTVRVTADRKLATNFAAKTDYDDEIHPKIRAAIERGVVTESPNSGAR